jgi:NAD(P)-dependent dehydrogenase (short-subunit alcohol dehydrogenase family)
MIQARENQIASRILDPTGVECSTPARIQLHINSTRQSGIIMIKSIIVTGGSRGIGAATARLAAQKGFAVCVNYQNAADAADAVVADIEAAGGKALAVQADVSNAADITRLFEATVNELGPLGAIINNGGITGPLARLDETSAEDIRRTIDVNLTGTALCCAEAVRRLSTKYGGPGGSIVNVSSAAARIGGANEWIDYAASKGGVDTLTIGLAIEVGNEGIRVNAVRPGLTDTDIHVTAGAPGRMAKMAPNIPMKRAASPEEIANAIIWLTSDEASYVNGAILDVAGGR